MPYFQRMNKLKARIKILCHTCGEPLVRTKTIGVVSGDKCEALTEAREKVDAWKKKLVGANCKVCRSILASV